MIKLRKPHPAYLELWHSGELARRVELGLTKLADCVLCPRNCHVNRFDDKKKVCRSGRYATVSSHFAHFGEERCLRGNHGSGAIFFSWCNLRCVFCQNYEISWAGEGRSTKPEELAEMMLQLQEQGCHNINLVTPEHVVPQILEALLLAVERDLRLPLVYNTSAYDSLDSLRLMDGIVDIYMPDFKFWDPGSARRYAKAPDYPETARSAIKEMHRQVGPLVRVLMLFAMVVTRAVLVLMAMFVSVPVIALMLMGMLLGMSTDPHGILSRQSASTISTHQSISNEANSSSRPARISPLGLWHPGHSPNISSLWNSRSQVAHQ